MASPSFVCARETLTSGLRVFVAPTPHLHRAHISLFVRIGSRYESRKTNGLSHFLEHMLYRGTPRLRSAHAVNLAFEQLGADLHASTHADFAVFSVTFPEESLDAASALFGEVLTAPEFFDIEVEKGIVCEEILEDLDDEGRQVDADNLSRSLIYPDHPLGFTITGDEQRVRSFDRPMVEAHYRRHYRTGGAVLVYAGSVTPARGVELAERDFGSLARGAPPTSPRPVHTQTKPRLLVIPNPASQTDLRVCIRAFEENAATRPALDLLMRVIDDGMSTRLYHRICDDKGLCYDVSAGYDGYEDDGVIDFAAGVIHARAPRVTSEILALLSELAVDGPSADEIEKAKRRHAWDVRAVADAPEDLAAFYGLGWLWNHPESPEDRQAIIGRVTSQQVQDVARSLAVPSRLNVVAVGLMGRDEQKQLADVVEGWTGLDG